MVRTRWKLCGGSTLLVGALVTVAVLRGATAQETAQSAPQKDVASLFKGTKFDAHYRVPNEGAIAWLLEQERVIAPGAPAAVKWQAVSRYLELFVKHNPTTVDPRRLRGLLNRERSRVSAAATTGTVVTDRSIKSLVALVEFNPTAETWTSQTDMDGNCVDTPVTMAGPLHNQMLPPGPRDNQTIWYEDTTPELYNAMYFGEGPNAGVVVHHPNLGTVDLRGKTMANYYLEMSNGKFAPSGSIYPKWLRASHSEGWYGEDSCSGSSNLRAHELVTEVIELIHADNPNFNWQAYDGNGDGLVDNFTIVHAGAGQESGSNPQRSFAIWSHASMVGWPDGIVVCSKGSAGCPDRDTRVLHYSMDPENIDLGIIAEEFGHAAFGLPDLYSTDTQGSVANWSIMEAGSWNGVLGGTEPAPFPLWFKYILGWTTPTEINYDDPALFTVVGQHQKTPRHTSPGLKVNLPDRVITVPNPLGAGKAWWSDQVSGANYTLTRSFDLTGATDPLFTFRSDWSLEADWDYGYVEVSADGGSTWQQLADLDGYFVTTNPNGNNRSVGLTGTGQGTLRFSLAAYAGTAVQVRLVFSSDTAIQWNGWFVDNFQLTDGAILLWSDDVEAGNAGWTTTGWTQVPLARTYPRFYLVEWRNLSGFDRGLVYPYATVYSDDQNWEVDRAPYTVPGMLVYLRDTSYLFDYTLNDSTYDTPSIGPKHGLLLVDSHFWPYEWDTFTYASGAHLRVTGRVQAGNAAFTRQPTTPFTIRLGVDPATGHYLPTPIQSKTFRPLPPVSSFHDSLGYYPGLLFGQDAGLYYWDRPASMVVPARDIYSTRITSLDRTPYLPYYGMTVGDLPLGSGNPGDADVQYGLHISVLAKTGDGSAALIATWNSRALSSATMKAARASVKPGQAQTLTIRVKNETPITQKYVVTGSVPQGTTFAGESGYDKAQNSARWEVTVLAGATLPLSYHVRLNRDLAAGTTLRADAKVQDEALGAAATASFLVVK